MKKQFPNNSTTTSNVYNANDWRTGIFKMKRFLTCASQPKLTINGTTATLNLSLKGMGSEFWNIENMTVTLSNDNVVRAIYVNSKTDTTDNATLKTFPISNTAYDVPSSETGVSAILCTICGTDLRTLVWQFDGFCSVNLENVSFSMLVFGDQNFHAQGEYNSFSDGDAITLDYYNTSVIDELHSRVENGTFSESSFTKLAKIIPYCKFSTFDFKSNMAFTSSSQFIVNGVGENIVASNTTSSEIKLSTRLKSKVTPASLFSTNGAQCLLFNCYFSNLGRDTLIGVKI